MDCFRGEEALRKRYLIIMTAAITLAGAAAIAAAPNSPSAKAGPFKCALEVTAEGVAIKSADDGGWSGTYRCAAEGARSFYFGPGRVATKLDGVGAAPYCIRVEFGPDGLQLTSVSGTNWRALSYSCGEAPVCRVVVTEDGIYGE
jgi:hypothetical protein